MGSGAGLSRRRRRSGIRVITAGAARAAVHVECHNVGNAALGDSNDAESGIAGTNGGFVALDAAVGVGRNLTGQSVAATVGALDLDTKGGQGALQGGVLPDGVPSQLDECVAVAVSVSASNVGAPVANGLARDTPNTIGNSASRRVDVVATQVRLANIVGVGCQTTVVRDHLLSCC